MLPRHDSEIDRLDVQHYALRAAVRGNYLAPIQEPARILDVGSGTGQWAYDLCDQFGEAVVVGFDLERSKRDHSANFRFVRGNLLRGLPFMDDRFDFVHQRLLMTAIPLKSWQEVVRDLVRVTAPGGWIELVEVEDQMEPQGPATTRLWELGNRLARSFRLDSTGIVPRSLGDYLLRAGAEGVTRREVVVPIGDWGERVGSLMASDFRALFTRLCPIFEVRFELPAGECERLVASALAECEQLRTRATFSFAYGRKASSR
jgi:SAM-dependent methyltransferase